MPDETYTAWRERNPLRAFRRAHGLPLSAIAAALEVHTQTVAQWEWGGAVPTDAHMAALAALTKHPTLAARWMAWYREGPRDLVPA